MGTIQRAGFSGGLFVSAGIAGLFWLYLSATAEPLMQEFAGPFQTQWEMLQWVFPTACLLLMFVSGLYLVFGGVKEEKARNTRRR